MKIQIWKNVNVQTVVVCDIWVNGYIYIYNGILINRHCDNNI